MKALHMLQQEKVTDDSRRDGGMADAPRWTCRLDLSSSPNILESSSV